MPKMPEVTVHVTTEPDPKEAREYKASADMWAEQCRTLQRTLLDTQIERDALRVQMKRAQQGIGEGITRPHDGPEGCPTYHDGCNCTVEVLAHNIERAQKAERRVAELEAILRRVDVYFQHTGKVGDLPVSVHALLPKLIHRHEDGTETAVTPLPMWQP